MLNRRHHVYCLHSANLPRPSLGNHHRCRPSNGEFDLGASSSHEALVLYCTALGTSVRTSKSIVWGPCKKQDATNYSGGSRRLLMRHRLRWEDRTTNGTGFYSGSFFCAPALNEMETHVVVTAVYRVCSPGAYCIFFFFFPVSRPLIACGRA